MTRYDFDKIISRRHTGSYKWDTADDDVLPLWVADMDFPTAPAIISALRRRVDHGIFGYTYVDEDYYSAVIDWFSSRHGWTISREWFIYTSGVVPAVSAIIKAMTRPGDKVITQTPAYNCFFSSIRNNDCVIAENPLLYDSETGRYTIDFDGLEQLAADPRATVMILCNPHNPSGRVWSRDELMRVADICLRNNVFVISDEIHCELTYQGHNYTPYGTLPECYTLRSSICVSPSKAFNTAGLQIADILTPDPEIRARIDRAININEVCDVNPFGPVATIAAYRDSADWLDGLREYIYDNYRLLCSRLAAELPALKVTPLEGTYLAWVNVAATGLDADALAELLLRRERLRINSGTVYGDSTNSFIRINLACPRSTLNEAITRLIRALSYVE